MISGVAGVLIWTSSDRHATMASFYRDTLGLEPRSDRPDFINFEWGGFRLTVAVHDGVSGTSREPLRIMVNLDADDIQAEYLRLRERGVEFSREPEQEPWGGWIATFADPDGNTIQLMQTE